MESTLVYEQYDEKTDRTAVVTRSSSYPNQPFTAKLYTTGGKLDHSRNFSTAGMAEAAADEWCSRDSKFNVGDRVFSHYVMDWGTIQAVGETCRDRIHGATGERLPKTTWYHVKMDNGGVELLDDAHGDWNLARIVPENVAISHGFGHDPAGAP